MTNVVYGVPIRQLPVLSVTVISNSRRSGCQTIDSCMSLELSFSARAHDTQVLARGLKCRSCVCVSGRLDVIPQRVNVLDEPQAQNDQLFLAEVWIFDASQLEAVTDSSLVLT